MTLKIGKRVSYTSRANQGTGKIVDIKPTARGNYVTIEDKNHPKGKVAVRESQVKLA